MGASLEALVRLGYRLGYSLVGTNFVGQNAFFVGNHLTNDRFQALSRPKIITIGRNIFCITGQVTLPIGRATLRCQLSQRSKRSLECATHELIRYQPMRIRIGDQLIAACLHS